MYHSPILGQVPRGFMENKKTISPGRQALLLGGMCSIAYLAVYVAKNALSAVGPQLTQNGVFTTTQLGAMSSSFFIAYAIGQLINGGIGDRIKGKYMISLGLILSSFGIFLLFFYWRFCRFDNNNVY